MPELGAMSVVSIFIKLNDHKLHVTDQQLEDLAVEVAEGKLDLEGLAAWLKKHSKKI